MVFFFRFFEVVEDISIFSRRTRRRGIEDEIDVIEVIGLNLNLF